MTREAVIANDTGLADVLRLGNRRAELMAKLTTVQFELWTAIIAANAAGESKVAIAKAAGVTRQTVYNVLAGLEAS